MFSLVFFLLFLAVGGFLNFFSFINSLLLIFIFKRFAEISVGNILVVMYDIFFSFDGIIWCNALLHAFRLNKEEKKNSNFIEAYTHSDSGEWNFVSVGISHIDVTAAASTATAVDAA